MKNSIAIITTLFFVFTFASCSSADDSTPSPPAAIKPIIVDTSLPRQLNYIALGDSYTIGQSVCETCRFPEQLRKKLDSQNPKNTYTLKIIAQTGWTTTNLISAINSQNLSANYDLVTLLIGVNNQYQNRAFSIYENEFPQLVTRALALSKGDKSNVIVVSIPDYAYTPFGKSLTNPSKVSTEIDSYNAFAQKYCVDRNIEFITITDITRQGLSNPLLVATDGLHPSELAYSAFVDRIFPKASVAINN
jgi:lysophospholipase L1-like esterase